MSHSTIDIRRRSTHAFRRASFALLFAGLLVTTAACGGASGEADAGDGGNTIRLATVTPFDLSDAPVFDDATWKGTGLKVERTVASSPTADQLLATGGADIVVQSANKPVADIAKGLPATIVAANSLSWGQNIIAKPDIRDAHKLKGTTFGVSGFGSGGYFATLKVAEHFGWAKGDYKVAQFGGLTQLTAALKSGAISAFIWNPQEAANLEAKGVARDLGSVDPYIKAAGSVFAVSNTAMKNRPQVIKKFFTAYFKRVAQVKADPSLALNLGVQKYKQDPSATKRVYKTVVARMSTDGMIPKENLAGMADAAKTADTDVKKVDMTKVYKYWKTIA